MGNNELNKKTIPVVFAFDEGYLNYTIVSMYSMLKNLSNEYSVRFVLLVPENIDEDNCKNKINEILDVFDNYTLDIRKIANAFDNIKLKIAHITTPTYYRLLLPDLLKDCEKCIYLDGDTIVLGDVSELYNIDIGDNYLGGVRALSFYKNEINERQRLGFEKDEKFEYVNAGILIINLDAMRKNSLTDTFMSLLCKEFDVQDQDILNVACKGKITIIPTKYNMMNKYANLKPSSFKGIIAEEDFSEAKENPVIIHYASKSKPWNEFSSSYADRWLEVVLKSDCWKLFAEQKTNALIKHISHPKKEENNFKKGIYLIKNTILYIKSKGIKYTVNRFLKK